MDHRRLVSVVIPTRNNGSTLKTAVRSALNQNVPVEIIIVDDASDVPAVDTLMELAGDHRVRILRNERRQGVARSRNLGVLAASGRLVAFLDADDWWEPGKLQAQLRRMKEDRTVLSCTARELADSDGRLTGKIIPVPERITYRDLMKGNCINCSSVVLLTKVAREFPMEHDDAHEDYLMWLRILKKYRRASGLNQPYLKYRLSGSGKSGSKWKSARMTYQTYRYAGFDSLKSLCCFVSYAVHGIEKYL